MNISPSLRRHHRHWLPCLLLAGLLTGCVWDRGKRDETLKHFRDHAADYDALLKDVTGNANVDLAKYQSIFPEGIEVTAAYPAIIEVTPVDFYYVLVFAPDEASLNASNAMKDEGSVLQHLRDGWHLVQRGFN